MKSHRQLLSMALSLFVCQSSFAWQAPAPAGAPVGVIPAQERAFTHTNKKDLDLLDSPFFPKQSWFKRHAASASSTTTSSTASWSSLSAAISNSSSPTTSTSTSSA
jgi:hypothetical protein